MAKAPIASTLFRFATTRNPQLLTKEERERGFIYFPSAEKGNSHFLDQLDNETDTEGRITYLGSRTATFNNLTTRQIVENVNSDLYDFSLWLMKNKNTVTSTEAATKAAGVTQLTTNQLVNMWDNLFYQVVSKKSDAVREAIIQMIVANNFLKKDDSQTTKSLITNDVDLQRLANGYVVITKHVANNIVSQNNTHRNISTGDQEVLNRELNAFESKQKAAEYKLAIDELNEVIKVNKNVNLEAYNSAQDTYLAAYDTAYANATKVVDSQTGEVSFTNLVLPDFSYTPNFIFKANYVNDKVSVGTLNLFTETVSKGIETEEELLSHLKTQRKKHYKTYVENARKRTNSVFYRGTIIRSDAGNLPEFSYAASAIATTEDPSKVLLLLNLATGFETSKVEDQTLNISFNTLGSDTAVALNVETSTTQTALLTSSTEVLAIPSGATSLTLSGTFTLDNGEELEISEEIEIGGNRSYGNATRKAQQDTKVVHHGINKVGVADFRRVEQEVCCYVPGEVSRIENILAKEYKERSTRQLLSTETSTETITENEVESLSDTTTSERNELSTEISAILEQSESQNYGASANVSGKFPGADITFGADTYFEGASGSSSSNANSTSQTKAEEITERALERVVQKVTKKRTSRILREFEENNKHGFDNREGTSHVTGVYRWVDKIYTNKLINYGKRLMYEFNVPEPSRFFKEAIIQQAKLSQAQATLPTDLIAPLPPVAPDEFVKEPNEIDDENYVSVASVYGAEVAPPPPETKVIGKAFSYSVVNTESGEYDEIAAASEQFELPDGYVTEKASARWFDSVDSNVQKTIIMVGDKMVSNQGTEFTVKPFTGSIPVSFSQYSNLSGNSSIRLTLRRTDGIYQKWQSDTYNAILEAYKASVREYEEKVREYNDYLFATFTPTAPAPGQTKLEFNPLLNRVLEKRELKRLAIQILAKPFNLMTSRNNYNPGSHTVINLSSRFDEQASQAKFFEQCFDWEIMAYTFYPYYYAAGGEWKNLFQQSNGIDNTFQAFLQSGMARAVVPVRPGFEEAVTYFLETGDMWMGNQLAIDRDDDLYLSIAEEVQSTEGVVEKEWETRVPTALTIVQANSAPLTENGLPCCHNEDEAENLAFGTSIMVGKDETTPSV